MNDKNPLNCEDSVSVLSNNQKNITLLLGLFQDRLNNFGKLLMLKQSSFILMVILLLMQSIASVTLSMWIIQIQKKIYIIQNQLKTVVIK